MLLDRDSFDCAYNQILTDAAASGGACSVLVIVANDCDAICASRILTNMFRSDNISYKIKPVQGYQEIASTGAELAQGAAEDLRSLVLLNCGGLVNVCSLLGLEDGHGIRVYIIDSHRPLHLTNIHSPQNEVVVFGDSTSKVGVDIPSDGEGLSGDDLSDEERSDSEDFSDEESRNPAEEQSDAEGEEGEAGNPQDVDKENQPVDQNTQELEADGLLDSDDDETDQLKKGKKRKRLRQDNSKKMRRRRIRQYYNGSFHGASSAFLVYDMSSQLKKDTNDNLWLAIIGLTDQYVHQKIDQDGYQNYVHYFELQVDTKSANSAGEKQKTDDGVSVPNSEQGRIMHEQDYKLMLYQHWNLYDSLYYSGFVASRLAVWRSNGRHALEELLAKMGVSLHQCRQKYTYMSPTLKKKLRNQLRIHANDYGLSDIFFESFKRVANYGSILTAPDMVYSITALLHGSNRQRQQQQPESDGSDDWIDNFNDAYDALLGKDQDAIRRGIETSIDLQKIIVNQAVSMIDKGQIVRLKHFRYAYIHSSAADVKGNPFTRPLPLGRLALFLVEVHRQNGKWAGPRSRPLVILSERADTYLVVGVPCPERSGDVLKNKFGMAFRLAADSINAKIRHDGFDKSVMEVGRDDVQRFIESLHYTMG